jgi:UDP-N-acetylmuramate dehydrogenase
VLRPAFADVRVLEQRRDEAVVRVEAGHLWDRFVDWTLEQGLAGLENLALIPGLAGAAPIQNIGAYGVEISEHLESVEAWDRERSRFVCLANAECQFGYRDSVFKQHGDRWVVTAVSFRLPRRRSPTLDYKGIGAALADAGISQPTARDVAEVVRRMRRAKLPYPQELGNAGSFFKNPIVPRPTAQRILAENPGLPVYPAGPEQAKMSAAWLIERCGWRGYREGDAGIAAKHALVLVNYGSATGTQLIDLARRVAASVQERFGVLLEPEPRIIGASFR